jgi:hypothetical protein
MEKCPLKDCDKMKKDNRATYEHRMDRKLGMLAVRCSNDNHVGSLLSNCFGIQPLAQVKRWSASF